MQLFPWKMKGIFSNLKQLLSFIYHNLPLFCKWKMTFLTLTVFVIQQVSVIQCSISQRKENVKEKKEWKQQQHTQSKYH